MQSKETPLPLPSLSQLHSLNHAFLQGEARMESYELSHGFLPNSLLDQEHHFFQKLLSSFYDPTHILEAFFFNFNAEFPFWHDGQLINSFSDICSFLKNKHSVEKGEFPTSPMSTSS